ncbi:MerR family transcriptional regulator [Streptomyces sp. NBC_00704]|uniref:MerR family transcriptional regulator n=1 Tax=Streptomyces sp. NBC_00704 TaxID=2975809 RepID=UPI002E36A1C3|nr:MerR family transcriptional regulator [Streptomyces sp. NBC_00704]
MTDRRLRTVDLARVAGLSTQQIRNYEETGVLPAAGRTESGYRVFGEVHRQALPAYRALVRGYGPVTAARIMRTVHAGDVPAALALVDEAHAGLHEERTALHATGRALEETAHRAPEAVGTGAAGRLRIGEAARLLGVRTSALRVWETAGLVAPPRERGTRYRLYGPSDVRDARIVHSLRRAGYPFAQIRPVLAELRREGGSTAELRSALAARARTLTARTRAMLAGAGRLHAYLDCLDRLYGQNDQDGLGDQNDQDAVSAVGTTTGSTAGAPGPSAT